MSNNKQTMKLYTEEQVIKMIEKSRETGLTADYLILSTPQIYLPSDEEIEEISKHEILYNNSKRSWWLEGAKYILNIIKIQGGNNEQ